MGSNSLSEWQGFFTYVGLVAGGLTGLIFVALSIQIGAATARSTYVARARVTLGALAGFVVLCGFALLPRQTSTAFGFESFVLLVVLIADVLRLIRAFEAAGEGLKGALLVRTAFALALFGIGALGAIGLLVDFPGSMLAVGGSTLLGLPVRIVQAWALLVAALPTRALPDDTPPPEVVEAAS